MVAGERDRPDVARRRAQWTKYQDRVEPERLVFIDETWTKTNMAPLRGWAPCGERLTAKVPHRRWKTTTFVAALRHEIELILKSVGLRSSFEHITAAEDIRNGKPDPEGYLHALQTLNRRAAVQASDCLVIEDTIAGIQAAHAAGLRCLAVSTTYPADQLAGADAVASTLKGYDLETLERRFWS